jgi:hypothetical protein
MWDSTINLIKFFKGQEVEKENTQNGGNFESDLLPQKKLTRYETFFNYVLEHNNQNYLPTNQEIYENLEFEGKKFTEFLVKFEKKNGSNIGDFVLDKNINKYKLIRKTKY